MYCNWLHNGKSPTVQALQDGAYDTSTFGSGGGILFTDQWQHHPHAKFWIPTLDEWLKAAHYDPNRYGPGQEGWWDYSYASDSPPVPGVPGVGQTNAGPIVNAWEIPLGAYEAFQSPWGLWDTSGGTAELTEEVVVPSFPYGRAVKGSFFGDDSPDYEAIWYYRSISPGGAHSHNGLRVASAVPTPGSICVAFLSTAGLVRRRKR
jgi:uncharacterized protein (TIGR03382 family)